MTAIPGDSCQNAFKDILKDQFREKIYNGFINDAILPVLGRFLSVPDARTRITGR